MKLIQSLNNKEFRLLLENFLSMSMLKLIGSIVPFIAIPYLIHTLGMSKYGVIVLGLSLISYFISIVCYGFGISGARDIAVNKSNEKYLSYKVSAIFSSQILLLIIATTVLVLIIFVFELFSAYSITYILFIPYLWGESLFPVWFFQGIQKMKYITVITSLVKIFFTLSVFLFIRNESDYWIYPIIISIGALLSLGLGILIIIKLGVKISVKFNLRIIKLELSNNFTLFLNSVTPLLFNNTTSLIIGVVLPTSSLGLFDAIRKITTIMNVLIQVVSSTIFPYLNRYISAFKRVSVYLIVLNLVIVIIPIMLYKLFLTLFYIPETIDNILILLILSLGVIFVGFSNIYGTNYLIIIQKEKYVLYSTILAAVTGLLTSYPFVVCFGIVGGALSIAISQVVLGSCVFCYYLKIKQK